MQETQKSIHNFFYSLLIQKSLLNSRDPVAWIDAWMDLFLLGFTLRLNQVTSKSDMEIINSYNEIHHTSIKLFDEASKEGDLQFNLDRLFGESFLFLSASIIW